MAITKRTVDFDHALEFYHQTIKPQLSASDRGRFIAIDPETETWEIGVGYEVVDRLLERVPDVIPVTIRHVYISIPRRGSVAPEVREFLANLPIEQAWIGAPAQADETVPTEVKADDNGVDVLGDRASQSVHAERGAR